MRVVVDLPDEIVDAYGGGFIDLLRSDLYERLLAALPPGLLQVNRPVDSIDPLVRRTLWDDTPKREHNLHIFGGYTFEQVAGAERGLCIISDSRTVQGSWTSMRSKGRDGYHWCNRREPRHPRVHRPARHRHSDERRVRLPAATAHRRHRLRKPATPGATRPQTFKQWSKGRVTLVGDAAHPTSPHTAYGAWMATEDGYFLDRQLAGVDLSDHTAVRAGLDAFEAPRKPHTARQVQQAYILGKVFHHAPPPQRVVRDAISDRTPFLQKAVDKTSPGEILAQIAAIDDAEARFTANRNASPGQSAANPGDPMPERAGSSGAGG